MRAARKIERLLREQPGEGSDQDSSDNHLDLPSARPVEDRGKRYEDGSDSQPSTSASGDSSQLSTPLSSDAGGMARRFLAGEAGSMAAAEAAMRQRAAALEVQLAELLKKHKSQQEAHTAEKTRLQEELNAVRLAAERDVGDVKARQAQLEASTPLLEEQIQTAKSRLRNITLTDSAYAAARAISPEKQSLEEALIVVLHERTAKLHNDIDALRVEQETTREALARANDEVTRLQRETQRASAAASLERKEMEREVGAVSARCERLEKELQDALLQAELLSAKGQLYDEVKGKAEQLEAKSSEWGNEKVVLETTLRVVEEERDRLTRALRDKEHANELLTMDKAYLGREVTSLQETVARLEAEAERQGEKLRELKRTRQELYDRMLKEKTDAHTAHEQRIQAEVARMEDRARQDLDQIRREAVQVTDREVRALREMRDAALVDSEKHASEARELRAAYEDLLSKHRQSQACADSALAELRAELKMKAFELDKAGVLNEETLNQLKQTKLQNEMLQTKVKVLTENYHSLDAGLTKQLAEARTELALIKERVEHYEMLEKDLDAAVLGAAAGPEDAAAAGWLERVGQAVPSAVRRRIAQSVELARRCMQLQQEARKAVQEKEAAVWDLKAAQEELARKQERGLRVQQPQAFLVESLQKCEAELRQTQQQKEQRDNELRAALGERSKLQDEVAALREDLRKLLEERRVLDSLHWLAAGTQSQAATQSAGNKGAQQQSAHKEASFQKPPKQQLVYQGEGKSGDAASVLKRDWYRRLASRPTA